LPDGTDWIEYMRRVAGRRATKRSRDESHRLGVPDIHAAATTPLKNGRKSRPKNRNLAPTASGNLNLLRSGRNARVELLEIQADKNRCCSGIRRAAPQQWNSRQRGSSVRALTFRSTSGVPNQLSTPQSFSRLSTFSIGPRSPSDRKTIPTPAYHRQSITSVSTRRNDRQSRTSSMSKL